MFAEIKSFLEDFLGTILIENKVFFFDYWSFIHFGSGILAMFLIFIYFKKMSDQKKFAFLLSVLVLWEIFELISSSFRPETKLDVFYDLIIGMVGGFSIFYFRERVF